jgi:Fic family protein
MSQQHPYQPPYTITPAILRWVAEISEWIGRYTAIAEIALTPRLRRKNRIRSIQASLAIENNTLSLEQVTAVIDGKRVLGHPREIQEVRNAFATYETMEGWDPTSRRDLLSAHKLLMTGLADDAGIFRSGGVGVFKGKEVVHMAPPAKRVAQLMDELLGWLKETEDHPLVTSSVFHYEFEFIHPFTDGNGRMGRLWQTLILSRWNPLFANIPVESLVHENQSGYYKALQSSTQKTNAAPFIEFMLKMIRDAVSIVGSTDQAADYVTDQVALLIKIIGNNTLGSSALIKAIGLSHRPTFRGNYLNPAMGGGWVERTQPDSPQSPTQRYRLTEKGRRWLQRQAKKYK